MDKKQRITIIIASISAALVAILIIFLLVIGAKHISANYDKDEITSTASNAVLEQPIIPDNEQQEGNDI